MISGAHRLEIGDSRVPEKVAMELSRHKTRAVFDRYSILNNDDLAKAVDKVAGHLETVGTESNVTEFKAKG